MKRFSHIGWMLLAVSLLAGCKREAVTQVEYGDLRLDLGTIEADFETRVEETPQDGYAFHNLLVVLTDDHYQVVDKVYKTYPYTPSQGDLQTAAGALPTEDVVYFQNLAVGTYHAYAYANIDHTDWQVAGQTIAEVEKNLHTLKQNGETVSLDTERTLKEFASGTAPTVSETDPMLLTGQTNVPVTVQLNEAEIALKRPLVRMNVFVNNHTPYDLEVQDIRFSPFNATKTYLLEHRAGSGKPPYMPEGNEFVDLPPLTGPVMVPKPVEGEDGDRTCVYSTLLYESTAESYKIWMQLALLNSGLVNAVRTLGTTIHDVRLMTSSEVTSMQPGESKTVLLVNPQNNANGVVVGWDGTDFVFRKAPKIKETEDYFTWLHNIVQGGDMEPYFLRLERQSANGPFALYSGDHNIFDNLPYQVSTNQYTPTGATGMNALAVSVVDPNKTWSQIDTDFRPSLLRFYCNTASTSNKDAYLWNSNGTALYTYADKSNQARQWVLYEVTSEQAGVDIKYVEKGTNKTKPVTYLARNHEYNMDINVYYVDFETQFEFRVENTWWTDTGGHTSSHIFE